MAYTNIAPPAGDKISLHDGRLNVPDHPVLPFIRGDGTGPDIWAASQRVFDAAVQRAYGGRRRAVWFEAYAGQTAKNKFDNWLPDDTIEAFKEFRVGIKGPLTTPVGGGIRSLNVALRQMLDLYVCLRPVPRTWRIALCPSTHTGRTGSAAGFAWKSWARRGADRRWSNRRSRGRSRARGFLERRSQPEKSVAIALRGKFEVRGQLTGERASAALIAALCVELPIAPNISSSVGSL